MSNQPITVSIGYGYFNPPINEQLAKQGFSFNEAKIKELESIRQAALLLSFEGFILDKAYLKIISKIQTKVTAHLKQRKQVLKILNQQAPNETT